MTTLQKISLLLVLAVLVGLVILCLAILISGKKEEIKNNGENVKYNGIIDRLNHNSTVANFTKAFPTNDLEIIFNRAKNPWRMTMATFQFIRFAGLIVFGIIALLIIPISSSYALIFGAIAILCFWYPMYYYKAIGDEREAEWNKMYEFIWVIKHNLMLYDPAKTFLNVKLYIQEHAPHDEEIIQGFQDFYDHWNRDEIDDYITRFYSFPVPKEIYQIAFNTSNTGEFPEDSLNNLRKFIINSQNRNVEKTLSGVTGQATIFSLPFLMISVIIALMIPMAFQLIAFL